MCAGAAVPLCVLQLPQACALQLPQACALQLPQACALHPLAAPQFAAEGLLVACAGMPEGKERREAARDMLQHGRTTWALTDGGSQLLPQRQDIAVQGGEEWWRRMEATEWAPPSSERVPGSDK